MAYSRPTASDMKSPQKSQIVTSDNYELTFILSERLWSLVHQFSHGRAAVHATLSSASPMTRWCRPDKVMQRSVAAAVHILIENLYKFKYFGVKKLILEFSDKS